MRPRTCPSHLGVPGRQEKYGERPNAPHDLSITLQNNVFHYNIDHTHETQFARSPLDRLKKVYNIVNLKIAVEKDASCNESNARELGRCGCGKGVKAGKGNVHTKPEASRTQKRPVPCNQSHRSSLSCSRDPPSLGPSTGPSR